MFVVRTQRIWQREPGHFSGLRVADTAVPLRYAAVDVNVVDGARRAGPWPPSGVFGRGASDGSGGVRRWRSRACVRKDLGYAAVPVIRCPTHLNRRPACCT
ncbi:hypothetical protein ACQCRK_23585 [Ralstonia pseudosolanacearum]